MGRNRYEKYSDPLTPTQKKELKHKEYKPDGEKRHLQIISFNNIKLVELLCDESVTVFDKSIAKEEILRRLTRESKRTENHKPKNKTNKRYKNCQKSKQIKKISENKRLHIGSDYHAEYNKFVENGGDTSSCPFD